MIPESVQARLMLEGWRSTDSDGHALDYEWRDAAGSLIGGLQRAKPFETPRPPGTYLFFLTVDDQHGGHSTDQVTVTIQAESTGGTNPSGPVAWTATVKVMANGANVIRSGGCSGCPDAGAASEQAIGDGGSFEFVPTLGGRLSAGLGADRWSGATPTWANTDPAAISHAFSFWPDGGWDIREGGQYRTEGRFVQCDVFRIVVENRTVHYYTSFLSADSEIWSASVQTGAP